MYEIGFRRESSSNNTILHPFSKSRIQVHCLFRFGLARHCVALLACWLVCVSIVFASNVLSFLFTFRLSLDSGNQAQLEAVRVIRDFVDTLAPRELPYYY
jgi:hypothetical protein